MTVRKVLHGKKDLLLIEEVKNLATDKDGYFYVVGSDEFLVQNIKALRERGIKPEQIMLDKREQQRSNFLSVGLSI